jgi:hypothetical protein
LGEDNLERTMCRSYITFLNLFALIEVQGYGIRDLMYFVKQKGNGMAVMKIIDRMSKVEEMLGLYEKDRVVNLTDIKENMPALQI